MSQFAVAAIVGIVVLAAYWIVRKLKKYIYACWRRLPGKYSWLAVFYTLCMGGASFFASVLLEEAFVGAALAIILFIIQWRFIFSSNAFQLIWQEKSFRKAFVLNSVLRVPLSCYTDIWILGSMTLPILEGFGERNVGRIEAAFAVTLLHGILVQIIYVITFLVIYVMCQPKKTNQDTV